MRFLALLLFVLTQACQPNTNPAVADTPTEAEVNLDPAIALIDEMLEAMGGLDNFRALKNIEYQYSRILDGEKEVLSLERYLLPSEWSWAKYYDARNPNDEDERGELQQFFAQDSSWVTFEGTPITDQEQLDRARFARKTNLYWLNMFFKMKDPGLTYELVDTRELYGQTYSTVKVSFEAGVGDATDIYFLYINEATKLVDYFLFTVMEFDHADAIMMKVKFEEVGGLFWPTWRASVDSNWEGDIPEDVEWTPGLLENLKVNQDFGEEIFE